MPKSKKDELKKAKKAKAIDVRPAEPDRTKIKGMIDIVSQYIPRIYQIKDDELGLSLYGMHAESMTSKSVLKRIEPMKEGSKDVRLAYLQGMEDAYKLELSAFHIQEKVRDMITGGGFPGQKPEDKEQKSGAKVIPINPNPEKVN